MLALGIRYLNGWAMAAADGANKEHAEWPPHPDRVFMALAAAWFETGEDPAEGAALRWLETREPPLIAASDATFRAIDDRGRQPVSYVPGNDARASKKAPQSRDLGKLREAGLALLPEHRSRNARHFPVAIPHRPDVHLIWHDAAADTHRPALERLARKVTNIGHSASLVQVWIENAPVEPRWRPTGGLADHRLRITTPGRLEYLRERCNREACIAHGDLQARIDASKGKEKTMLKQQLADEFGDTPPLSLRPEPGLWRGYAERPAAPADRIGGTVFDPRLLVFSLHGRRLPLPATLRLTSTLRGTLLKEIANGAGASAPGNGTLDAPPAPATAFPYPEWLSGHAPGGAASDSPHLALAPLPFVGREHADGRIMGLALVLPKDLDEAEAGRWLEPWLRAEDGLPRPIRLFDGPWLDVTIELETRESRTDSLRPPVWTAADGGACLWASATPVVLDRHFKGAHKWQKAAESVKDACERIGLPRPAEVELHPVSKLRGAPRANEFPPISRKSDGGRMHHVHAFLAFDEPVAGPILIGAGRFRGYGLCRPLNRCNPRHHGDRDHG